MISSSKCLWAFAALLLISSLASAQVVNVSPVPGNNTASGTNLLNALAGIVDATSAKPYVLRLQPGIYDIGGTALVMKPYVDIEGSGQQSTIIRGLGNDSGFLTAVVLGASRAELRGLQVQSSGSGYAYSIAVLLNQASTSLRDVTLTSSSATSTWGLRILSANANIQNVTITVAGGTATYGISNTGGTASSPVIRRAVINVSGASSGYGIYSDQNASPRIRDVEITVSSNTGYGIEYNYINNLTGATLEVANARINVVGTAGNASGIDFNGEDTVVVTHTNISATSPASGAGLRIGSTSFSFLAAMVDHCDIQGSTNSIAAQFYTVRVGASKLSGPANIASPSCAASFNGSYVPLSASCL
jgi:hypothetical protein